MYLCCALVATINKLKSHLLYFVAVCNLYGNTRGLLHLLVRLSAPETAAVCSYHTLVSTASKIHSAVTHNNTAKIRPSKYQISGILGILKDQMNKGWTARLSNPSMGKGFSVFQNRS